MDDLDYTAILEEENEKLRNKHVALSKKYEQVRKHPVAFLGMQLVVNAIKNLRNIKTNSDPFGSNHWRNYAITLACGRGAGHTTLARAIQRIEDVEVLNIFFHEGERKRFGKQGKSMNFSSWNQHNTLTGKSNSFDVFVFDECHPKDRKSFLAQLDNVSSVYTGVLAYPLFVFLGSAVEHVG